MPGTSPHITEYVSAFQRGEEKAFNFFFLHHYSTICLFSFNITKNKEASEEIAEDAFLKLWERHKKFSHPNTIKSYLYTVAKTTSLNWLRQQKRENLNSYQLAYLSDKNEDHILQKLIAAEIYVEVHKAIKTLPPQCRRIFQMLYIEGKDYQQIASELNLSASTIRNQKARAIMLLKQQIDTAMLSLLYFFLIFF